jgi:hypothetical protein
MDLSIIIGDWPYDEQEEANNVRKIVGLDGAMKIQVRLRTGVVQWSIEGRPDGRRPHGFATLLHYCRHLAGEHRRRRAGGTARRGSVDLSLVDELGQELFDYCRRCRALFLFGDYRRALADVHHGLAIVDFIRRHSPDPAVSFSYDQYRTSLVANRAQAEMLWHMRSGGAREALDALSKGIADIERFYLEYEMDEEVEDCDERQLLIDLRRSLREKHGVPLSDGELLRSLRVEQQIAIRRENYEMAARLRDKISLLKHRMTNG